MSTEPQTKVVEITPELATKILEGNTHNRPIKQNKVDEYADQMRRHQWRLNGESIIIDKNDTLLDGQHRLFACVMADTSFETVVVRNIDPDSFATIDTGVKRSASDVLSIAGLNIKYTQTVAAAANICIEYHRGVIKRRDKGNHISREDVLKYVQKNPQLCTWVEKARSNVGWASSYASPVSAVVYLGSIKYREKAELFMHGWSTGENLGSKSPILALRHRLGSEKRMLKATRVGLVIHAWNCFVDSRELVILKVPKGDNIIIRGTERAK